MLFNSLSFLLFFPVVCLSYWLAPDKFRNGLLLIASYFFYMCWEPAYALIILFTSISTWYCGNKIFKVTRYRSLYVKLCLSINLLILFFFKYYNFAIESLLNFFSFWEVVKLDIPYSSFLLPVGISFYTFQSIGYIIDVYRKEIEPEKNFITYALFVSFFPQLVAGPIERAKNLIPQFHQKHIFDGDGFIDGLKMMIWGYFMKLCVAGNVAPYVDAVYNNVPNHNGTSLLLATFFFAFQIFCDFGGYSLIAIGTARCMGFTLMQNFNHPYLSLSVKDFWHRWHISLSSWFGSYVYISLGGSRCSRWKHCRNLMITMLVSGIWHGANWTFVFWGGLHGVFLVVNTLYVRFVGSRKLLPKLCEIFATWLVVCFAWIFFRANSLKDSFIIVHKIISDQGTLYEGEGVPSIVLPLLMIGILIFKEIKDEYHVKIALVHHRNSWISIPATALLVVIILLCAEFNSGKFIYFQF